MKRNKKQQKALRPARPVPSDMLNCRIEYVYAEPYMREKMVGFGTIIELKMHRNLLYLLVKPELPNRIEKWVTEHQFIAYAHLPVTQIEKAIA